MASLSLLISRAKFFSYLLILFLNNLENGKKNSLNLSLETLQPKEKGFLKKF